MKAYDVCIAYRIFPKSSSYSSRPLFGEDKLKLAELCLISFKESLGDLRAKLLVILDECPPIYEKLFLKLFKKEDIEFIHFKKSKKRFMERANAQTFLKQIQLLLDQDFSENVYLAEDDYFYTQDSFKEMLNFVRLPNIDFVTPYDHLDYYTENIHKYKKETIRYGKRLWRETGSTCCTFLTTKETLAKTRNILKRYLYIGDASMWFALTKKRVFFGMKYWKFNLGVWYSWKQIIFGKKYTLWNPIPSIATHMESKFLAPKVKWGSLFNQTLKRISLTKDLK